MSSTSGKVFIVDDDDAVRNSLRMLFKTVDIDAMTFESGDAFLHEYDADWHGCVILDIRMPGTSGLEVQKILQERGNSLPIIFITGHGDVPMAVDAMKKGALDFVQKPFDEAAITDLVERMLDHAAEAFEHSQQAASRDALLAKLTSRETQVLERIVAGRLNKQIADDLNISIKTVEAHRANIMEKLGANTVADLLKIALASSTVPQSQLKQ